MRDRHDKHQAPEFQMCCLICEKKLEDAIGRPNSTDDEELYGFQPHGATAFYTWGHYGSTVFDPNMAIGSDYSLEIFVCDACLVERKERILHRSSQSFKHVVYKPWDPEGHDS